MTEAVAMFSGIVVSIASIYPLLYLYALALGNMQVSSLSIFHPTHSIRQHHESSFAACAAGGCVETTDQ